MIQIDDKGREIVDPKPMDLPLNAKYPESLESMMRRMIHQTSEIADKHGWDTEEEANDFDVEDGEPMAPWEYDIDRELEDKELRIKAIAQSKKAKQEFEEFEKWKTQRASNQPGGSDGASPAKS